MVNLIRNLFLIRIANFIKPEYKALTREFVTFYYALSIIILNNSGFSQLNNLPQFGEYFYVVIHKKAPKQKSSPL